MKRQLKFTKIQKLFLATMAALVLIMIVFYDEASMIKQEKLGFHVLESDELFFKNIRQYYYEREWQKEAQFELFRFEKRIKAIDEPTLNFTIVCNWLHDQAYILPEIEGVPDSLNYSFCIVTADSLVYNMGLINNEDNLMIAFNTYKALINDESRFYLRSEDQWKQVFKTVAQRNAVKQVLKDFFKLTGAL
jgi:hypothetical protein